VKRSLVGIVQDPRSDLLILVCSLPLIILYSLDAWLAGWCGSITTDVNELIRRYTPHPVLVIVDVNPRDDLEIPTTAYITVESRPDEKTKSRETFVHLPCEIGAHEAEEVGVEHLLRNIRDNTGGTMSDAVIAKLNSLKGNHSYSSLVHCWLL
jgi:hypothetical protein